MQEAVRNSNSLLCYAWRNKYFYKPRSMGNITVSIT